MKIAIIRPSSTSEGTIRSITGMPAKFVGFTKKGLKIFSLGGDKQTLKKIKGYGIEVREIHEP
jgi:hypothetical protein